MLSDAFLLDPQKLDVWIALRTDGVRGSGTESDPYDGSVRTQPLIAVTSLTRDSNPSIAIAATGSVNHGYFEGDVVTIAGVTGGGAAYYNGTFNIFSVAATGFKYQMTQDPGANSSGSITCQLDPRLFDAAMRRVAQYSAVRIGPGVFETRGRGDDVAPAGWQPQSHQKISGSGMGVTVLKLVEASVQNATYGAVLVSWSYSVTDVEVSDLTVDCNFGGQPIPPGMDFPPVRCAAVSIRGSHIRIRRVQAINFGCHAPELFVISTAWAHPLALLEPLDSVIEECIAEQPALNTAGLITVLHLGGSENPNDGVAAYHRACAIRNCVVDCEYRDNPVSISQITFSGTTATVTTRVPHGRAVDDWVRISGALVNNSEDNPYNGSFKITAISGSPSSQFQYTMASTPSAAPTGDMWVGRFSSHIVPILTLTPTQVPNTNDWDVVITTAAPHFRVPGGNVFVDQVYVGQYPNQTVSTLYNGSFKVLEVTGPKSLKYRITSASPPGDWYPSGLIGVYYQALSADGGTSAVAEGNRVFNCRTGGPYHDYYNTKDLIVRNNHYRGVATGPFQNMGKTNALFGPYYHNTNPPHDKIQRTGVDGKTALFTSQYDHGFLLGQGVHITGSQVQGQPPIQTPYNGYFAVDSTPALNQFTYRMNADPQFDADASPVPQFARLWQTGSIIIENNIIELISSANGWGQPIGIPLAKYQGDPDIGSQRIFKRVVIRRNVIKHVDNVSDASGFPLGILLTFCANAIVEENVIDLATPIPIQHYKCDQLNYFNNTDPAGLLIQGVDVEQAGNPKQSELTSAVQDAYLLAI